MDKRQEGAVNMCFSPVNPHSGEWSRQFKEIETQKTLKNKRTNTHTKDTTMTAYAKR